MREQTNSSVQKVFQIEKYNLIEVVSDGMRNEYGTFEENYKIIAQGYERGDGYIKTALERLKQKKENDRRMTNIVLF